MLIKPKIAEKFELKIGRLKEDLDIEELGAVLLATIVNFKIIG